MQSGIPASWWKGYYVGIKYEIYYIGKFRWKFNCNICWHFLMTDSDWIQSKIQPHNTCQVSRFQRESRFKASNHALTLTPIITLTQNSTNLKILVKIIKLHKQNWFAQYGINQWRLQTLKLLCVVCSREFSCAHQGEADIKRHILTKTHKDKSSSLLLTMFCKTMNWLLKCPGQKFSWPILLLKTICQLLYYSYQIWPIVQKYVPRFANCKKVSMC
jgi:hypothetical protein